MKKITKNDIITTAKASHKLLDIDFISKILIIMSSIYWITRAPGNSFQDRIFIRYCLSFTTSFAFKPSDWRYVWIPQALISSLLMVTRLLSHFTAHHTSHQSSKLLMGDVFILTTFEKLLAIGYNGHLIIFFTTRRLDFYHIGAERSADG